MNLNPIAGIIESVGQVVGDLVTTDKERREADLADYKAETERMTAQTDINKVEAASESRFVSGARPFILWVCGVAMAYVSLIEPIARFVAKVMYGYTGDFPVIDTDLTMQVLLGLLGLGAMRSVDKFKRQ